MTRSIDNAFVRALSRKRPVQLADSVTTDDGTEAPGAGTSPSDKSARIDLAGNDTFIRIEKPTPGESAVAAPHLSFQPEPAQTAGPVVSNDLAAFLSFSTDTQTTFTADSVPLPTPSISPSAPPQPHIAPSGTPHKSSQQAPETREPETREPETGEPELNEVTTPESLNEAEVERILRQREHELNTVFQRRLFVRTAERNEGSTVATPETEVEVGQEEVEGQAPFQPAWEVDVFQWPETVEELLRDQGLQFTQAGEQLRHAAAEGLQVLGVTSTFRGEGRTSLSMCIARSVALAGAKVVLVDMDVDHADLAATLRVRPPVGWRETIDEELAIEESIIHSVEDGVSLVSLESGGGTEIGLRDLRVGAYLETLRQEYELVILDCGPLVDESKFFEGGNGCPLNAAIVVRDLRTTSVDDCQKTVARLLLHGVEAVGVAENFMRSPS